MTRILSDALKKEFQQKLSAAGSVRNMAVQDWRGNLWKMLGKQLHMKRPLRPWRPTRAHPIRGPFYLKQSYLPFADAVKRLSSSLSARYLSSLESVDGQRIQVRLRFADYLSVIHGQMEILLPVDVNDVSHGEKFLRRLERLQGVLGSLRFRELEFEEGNSDECA